MANEPCSKASILLSWRLVDLFQQQKELNVEMALVLPHEKPITCVTFNQDGKYLAAGCDDGKAYIYDVRTGILCNLVSFRKVNSEILLDLRSHSVLRGLLVENGGRFSLTENTLPVYRMEKSS